MCDFGPVEILVRVPVKVPVAMRVEVPVEKVIERIVYRDRPPVESLTVTSSGQPSVSPLERTGSRVAQRLLPSFYGVAFWRVPTADPLDPISWASTQ